MYNKNILIRKEDAMKAYKNVIKCTKALNKKGLIKGSSKKETKTLEGMCASHKINKKGKVVPQIKAANGYCYSTMVRGVKFPANFYSKDDLKEEIKKMEMLNEQAKFMAVATNAGEDMVDYFASIGIMLKFYKKNYKRIKKVAEKQGAIKNKKKKGYGRTTDSYGTWSHN